MRIVKFVLKYMISRLQYTASITYI